MGLFDRIKTRISGKATPSPANPITKLEWAISTWDREQAKIALAIFAAMVIQDQAPLESLFGKGAKVETAIGHLTVGQVKVLHSIMTETVPDVGDGENEEDL